MKQVIVDSWARVDKSHFTPEQILALRKKLTLYPQKFMGSDLEEDEGEGPLQLFEDTTTHFGVPRSYFMQNRKPEHLTSLRLSNGAPFPSPLKFDGVLRPEQQRALDVIRDGFFHDKLGGIIKAVPSFGKCLGLGTKVLLHNGDLKAVEDVVRGDLLMGPDSTPREVLSTTRGVGPLFEIVPLRGQPWVCNDAHILTLVHSKTGEIFDVPLRDWEPMRGRKKHYLKQFAPPMGVAFPPSGPLPLDPYFLGVWYGDGKKSLACVAISKPDKEIEELCHEMAKRYGLFVRKEITSHLKYPSPTYYIHRGASGTNSLLNLLREIVGDGASLPKAYLCASREDRLRFLAGLLDSGGYYNTCYEIAQKHKRWCEDIMFLARSLGYFAQMKEKIVNGDSYWRVIISGDFSELPMRIPRKKAIPRRKKRQVSRSGFSVQPLGTGEYAGFTLDGDGRFLLGDFVVTHNTVLSCAAIASLQVPTLVVVHKEFLMDQWRQRLNQFLPGVRVGVIQREKFEYQNCHVVLGMIHTLAKRNMDALVNHFGLFISDECFPAGTLVDGRPIETIVEGDMVTAYCEKTDRFIEKRVTHVFRNTTSVLVRMRLTNGFELVGTWSHPILTEEGWRPLGHLKSGDEVFMYAAKAPEVSWRLMVGSVETFERVKDAEIFNTLCPTGEVYNLEVEDLHTYTANGVVVHNCHHISARSFLPVVTKFACRYRLGLSATPQRKDGTDLAFTYHMGPVVFETSERRLGFSVRRVYTNFQFAKAPTNFTSASERSTLLRFLTSNEGRNTEIVKNIIEAVKAKRKIIVLSERREHLIVLRDMLLDLWGARNGDAPTTDFYVGGMNRASLAKAAKASVIFATNQFASEGLDIPALDTLFLTTPVTSVEQCVGRILRPCEGKAKPVVVDVIDSLLPVFKNMARKRDVQYTALLGGT